MESGANISQSITAESPTLNYQVGFSQAKPNIDILNWSIWSADASVASLASVAKST